MTSTPPSVPLPGTAFRVPPPEPPRKPLRVGPIIACGVIVLAVMGFVGIRVARKFLTARDHSRVMADLGATRSDMYTMQRRDYMSDPTRYRNKAALDLASFLRRKAPQGTFSVSESAAVDATGPALRMVVEYRASVPGADGHPVSLHGHLRQYIHPWGIVSLDSACATDYSMCLRYDELVAAAERSILEHVGEGDLESVTPAEGDCEKKQTDMGPEAHFTVTCTFDANISLTFERFGIGAAHSELFRRAIDPGDRPVRRPQE